MRKELTMTTLPSTPVQLTPNPQQVPQRSSISGRYADAYFKANLQNGLGTTIKTLSLVIGGLIAGFALLYALSQLVPQQGMFGATANPIGAALGFFAAIVGAAMAGIGWIFGALISSQGQLLKATLDSAVNTSPFLDDSERARMMSL
ncbi:MAG: hypothetical protein WAL89_21750 [Candidatus Sulfotelmatobacter sp.]|jgi:hypothetical protein